MEPMVEERAAAPTGARATALLTQTAVYALRALASLAALPSGESATATRLAQLSNVPLPYLSKVLRRLAQSGLLVAQRGHGGGYSLARPALSISFLEVLEALGEMPETGICAFGWGACDACRPCPLHAVWSDLNRSFRDWAATNTLDDVIA